MCLLLEHKGTCELSLKLLQIVVSVVPHLVANADDHELELVDLTDGLGSRCLLLNHGCLGRHGGGRYILLLVGHVR